MGTEDNKDDVLKLGSECVKENDMKDLNYYIEYVKNHKTYGHSKVLHFEHQTAGCQFSGGYSKWSSIQMELEYPDGTTMKSFTSEKSFVAQVLADMLMSQGANEETLDAFREIQYEIGRDDEIEASAEQ